MLLTVDIGNSSISVGVFPIEEKTSDGMNIPKPLVCFKLSTETKKSADEYAIAFYSAFLLRGFSADCITAVMLSSVVPNLTDVIRNSIAQVTDAPTHFVGPGLKSGVNIRTEAPAELGADIVANAAAILARVNAPAIMIDVGTATSIFVIDENRTVIGGCIAPGLKIGLDALKDAASLLPTAALSLPGRLIGRNTDDAVRSGVINGHAMMLDGMIAAMRQELQTSAAVVITGGLAPIVMPAMKETVQYAEYLTLEGLYCIYSLNACKLNRGKHGKN